MKKFSDILNENVEDASAFKELSKYYQQLRDNKTPDNISESTKNI